MAQKQPIWEETEGFIDIARKLIDKYSIRFADIDISKIIAYSCINKTRKDKESETGSSKLYKLCSDGEPENFTNQKTWFVKMYSHDWQEMGDSQKEGLVYEILSRIDPKKPGKVRPLDYQGLSDMVKRFGHNWFEKRGLPSLLKDGEVNVEDFDNEYSSQSME